MKHAKKRIGIYAGTFDPVHSGHLSFALLAMQQAKLDELSFLPERLPRYKPAVTHYGHRVAMLTRAIVPYPQFSVLEMVDRHFTVRRSFTALQRVFGDAQIVFLMGSDVLLTMTQWPHYEELVASCEFIVSIRDPKDELAVQQAVAGLGIRKAKLTIVHSLRPEVSSHSLRLALSIGALSAKGLLPSVTSYARQAWLYTAI